MSVDFVLNAQVRSDVGKGASRRLRRHAKLVPAVVYGGEQDPVSIALPQKDLNKAVENEAFYSHLITLTVGDTSEEVILTDLQRHPAKPVIMHADFLRVSRDRLITVNVPLHFINENKCYGVKEEGGLIQHNINELETICLPQNLPEYIEVDMLDVHVGTTVHISDLELPENVSSVELGQGEKHDRSIAVVLMPRAEEIEEAVEGDDVAAEEPVDDDGAAGDDEGGDEA